MNQIELGNLCVWGGVQDVPGVRRRLPFSLQSLNGLLRLHINSEDKKSIVGHYADEDYSFITSPPGASDWGSHLGDAQFEYIRRFVGELRGKTVLEIGSGSLYMAERIVKELGAKRFIACDPVLKKKSASPSVEVFPDYFSSQAFKGQNIDLVMSMNNLEHVPDPLQYLSDIREILNPSRGLFFVMVPDCTQGLRRGDWGICLHEHLSYFTQDSFCSTMANIGFDIKEIISEEDEIIAVCAPSEPKAWVPVSPEESLSKIQKRFEASYLYAKDLFSKLESNGKGPVGIHGCSVAANQLLSELKLENSSHIYLFDRDEAKHGKFLPSFHRAILSTSSPEYKKMGAMVVGVSTYFDNIRNYALRQGFSDNQIFSLIPFSK
ncbi:MAG: hypothetical protein KCHDKBKB_01116 [Elusimicrobia bacterium]|nr:hypothetical protein [Elusimicrobiota bacterium]